jgi:hypothetical protein
MVRMNVYVLELLENISMAATAVPERLPVGSSARPYDRGGLPRSTRMSGKKKTLQQ